eukprot:1600921-Rhodomonas_salina.1
MTGWKSNAFENRVSGSNARVERVRGNKVEEVCADVRRERRESAGGKREAKSNVRAAKSHENNPLLSRRKIPRNQTWNSLLGAQDAGACAIDLADAVPMPDGQVPFPRAPYLPRPCPVLTQARRDLGDYETGSTHVGWSAMVQCASSRYCVSLVASVLRLCVCSIYADSRRELALLWRYVFVRSFRTSFASEMSVALNPFVPCFFSSRCPALTVFFLGEKEPSTSATNGPSTT